ncbi:MAG: DNA repair protein RecN [Spirochaetaceae bacterium]|jgi:DNA repair protein RecN (Recombination protein N)|nr:DNA repair protein RecN [Spirochaetaceae bacterium]
MLEELTVRNYALIDSLTISFQDGLTILTGETGAGKSIMVGALSFLLGAKADPAVIRTGAEEAGVSALLSLRKDNAEALGWLSGRDIETDDGELVIRRSVKSTGRGAAYIQNVPVTRADLEEFMALLFDIHGQHAHESLLRKENHRRYLDRFAGLGDEAGEFNRLFLSLAEKKKAYEISVSSEHDRETRLEILNYAVEEINQAKLKSGESRELEAEAARLGDFEKLAGFVNTCAETLFDGEFSVVSLARRAKNALDNAASIDADLAAARKRLEDLFYEAEDLSGEFRSYRDGLHNDPARLEEVEERLNLIYRLKKKYAAGKAAGKAGASSGEAFQDEDAILAYREQAEAEIEALSGAGENREKLKAEIAALEKDITGRAASLSAKRAEAAEKLAPRIGAIIAKLGMPNARFQVSVAAKNRTGEGPRVIGQWGADEVEFLISANKGEPLKDLARIASGGELSRVMLAIKTALVDSAALSPGQDSLETLIFDEIDTGIGGEVALSVGEYLAKIGTIKQIFCVTHLASIAVRADNHLKVEKHVEAGRTLTTVSPLAGKARREEIARMLAGDSAGSAALAHADELLVKYRRGLNA